MHLMHILWIASQIIGFFHGPAVIVITVMTIIGVVLVGIFVKVFAKDLFGDSPED